MVQGMIHLCVFNSFLDGSEVLWHALNQAGAHLTAQNIEK